MLSNKVTPFWYYCEIIIFHGGNFYGFCFMTKINKLTFQRRSIFDERIKRPGKFVGFMGTPVRTVVAYRP